jgi:hypothetical protein
MNHAARQFLVGNIGSWQISSEGLGLWGRIPRLGRLGASLESDDMIVHVKISSPQSPLSAPCFKFLISPPSQPNEGIL